MQSIQTPDERPLRAVDLFCGAGGLSTALAIACEQIDREIDLVAVNHWNRAIETHKENHPWAEHYQSKIEDVDPDTVFTDDRPVDILVGGPECTHFSTARGGKPVSEQKRMPAWHVLTWVQKLQPETILLENVREFQDWGPIEDGEPTRNGELFQSWIRALEGHGYNVDWRVLNAANYGDATSRERLFVIGHRDNYPQFPVQTHCEYGHAPGKDQWRSSREILDWDDPGQSIWTRGMEGTGKRPLVSNTMDRIAEGLRRHGDETAETYADTIESLDKDQVAQMQKAAIPIEQAEDVAEITDDPFLVTYEDADTVLCEPYLLRQQSGGNPPSTDEPLPTISTKGAIAKIEPYLIQYYGQSGSKSVDEPLPTVTTKGRFALIVPECYPAGIDIRYRMLQPRELANAMGFPPDYEFCGNKTETIEQIGNAVPVNLGTALSLNVLLENEPQTLESPTDTSNFVVYDD